MAEAPTDLIELVRAALAAMGEYRGHVAVIGGMAPFVYRHHPAFDHSLPFHPLGTKDVDVVVPLPLPILGSASLFDRMRNGGLFIDIGRGLDGSPGAMRFYRNRGAGAPYVEFIVRDPGRKTALKGKPQPDLLAQTGDFQELLLPPTPIWQIDVPGIGAVPVPHPSGYIAQKTRLYDKGGPRWRKDQSDIVLVVWAFQSIWPEMVTTWKDIARHSPQKTWLKRAEEIWRRLYAQADSDGPKAVAEVFRSHGIYLRPDHVHQVMQDFLLNF